MKIYIDIFTLALVVIYIIDVSGFTESWRDGLAKALSIKQLRPLPPFDCSKCAVWWTGIIYALTQRELDIYTIAFSALLSLLSVPFGQLMLCIRENLNSLINRLY